MEGSDIVEGVVAQVGDLQDGQMKEVQVAEGLKVLLVKEDGQFKALGNRCTHYGAPLRTGAYSQGQIRCPWHGACFNTDTGDIEDYPGMDCLAKFDVSVQGSNVVVRGEREAIKSGRRKPKMASANSGDSRVFCIVGAGPSGLTCAENLRAEGFTGRIVMYGREKLIPYDRTKLSKAMTIEHERITIRPQAYFQENDIEIHLGKQVSKIDVAAQVVHLEDGSVQKYDAIYVATGGDPRILRSPGHELQGIYTLRQLEDAHAIAAKTVDKNVVIIGTSFIGMEVASCIAAKAKSVTVMGMENVPFERVLGRELGVAIQTLFQSKNVTVMCGRNLVEFRGSGNNLEAVVIKDSTDQHETILPADICVVGAGAVPNVSYFKEAADAGLINIARDNTVICDEFMCAGPQNVFVGGDIARFPYHGDHIRVEHWGLAQTHGKIAAKNMVKPKSVSNHAVPFFWTAMFGKTIRYVGHAASFDEVLIDGEASSFSFVAFYLKGGNIVAVATAGKDPIATAIAAYWDKGHQLPPVSELRGKDAEYYLRLAAAAK